MANVLRAGRLSDLEAQFKFVVPGTGRASFTFDKPGICPYFCDAHAQWNAGLKRVQARPGSSEYPADSMGAALGAAPICAIAPALPSAPDQRFLQRHAAG